MYASELIEKESVSELEDGLICLSRSKVIFNQEGSSVEHNRDL